MPPEVKMSSFSVLPSVTSYMPLPYQKCGTQNRTRLHQKIATAIGSELCEALIGLHAYTGFDTMSAFAGKGKLRALQILKKRPDVR